MERNLANRNTSVKDHRAEATEFLEHVRNKSLGRQAASRRRNPTANGLADLLVKSLPLEPIPSPKAKYVLPNDELTAVKGLSWLSYQIAACLLHWPPSKFSGRSPLRQNGCRASRRGVLLHNAPLSMLAPSKKRPFPRSQRGLRRKLTRIATEAALFGQATLKIV